ncbi:hypothetical protein Tco_0050155, partial [Tanacetum coccineum]
MNQVLNENEQLLEQVINEDILNIIMNSTVDNASVKVHERKKCLKLETELLNKKDFIEKETYDKLFRSFTTLEKTRVSILIAENEHLKQTYKQLYDSIKPTRIRSKEQCDAFINQVNQKSVEISDLNVSLQEKDLVITTLKGVKPSTSASGSQPSDNTKKDKIQRTSSSTQKNKVEAHPR